MLRRTCLTLTLALAAHVAAGTALAQVNASAPAAAGAAVTTAAPVYTTGTNNSLSLKTNGSLRVAGDEDGTVGSAAPASAGYSGAVSSGNLAGLIQCDSQVAINSITAATTELVALSGTTRIYVCGYALTIQGVATTPASIKFVQGTGAACATGTTDLTGPFTGSTVAGSALAINAGSGLGSILRTSAGSALCMTTATTTLKSGVIFYTRF